MVHTIAASVSVFVVLLKLWSFASFLLGLSVDNPGPQAKSKKDKVIVYMLELLLQEMVVVNRKSKYVYVC